MLTLISLPIKSHQAEENRIMQNTTGMRHAQLSRVVCPRLSLNSQDWMFGLCVFRTELLKRPPNYVFLKVFSYFMIGLVPYTV